MNVNRLLFSFLVLLVCVQISFAQKDFYITNYTTKNGLPENNLQSLQIDKDDFLWASYSNGLLRFDGNNFRNYVTSKVPYTGFYLSRTLNNELLAWDASGTVFEIKNQQIDTLRKGALNSINYYVARGTLPSKDFYLKGTSPHFNDKRDKSWVYPPLFLFPQNKQDCIIRTETGLGYYRFSKKIKDLNLLPYNPRLFISINKEIYFFDIKNNLFWVDVKSWRVFPCQLEGGVKSNPLFYKFPELLSATFWDFNTSASCFLLENDLYELSADKSNPTILRSSFITNSLPLNCIITSLIYKPHQGLLLISTDTKGLFVYREQKFKLLTYPHPERGTNNSYYCQLELDSNRVYTDWGREFSIKGGKKSSLVLDRNYSENIFRDCKNRLWYLSGPRTLKRYDPSSKKTTTIYNPRGEFVNCYYEEGDSIWIGSATSIGYVKNDSLRIVHTFDNNGSNSNLFQILRWNDKKLWLCNYTGVYTYDPISHDVDTLPKLYQSYPYNFTVYKNYLMIGTYGRGFYFHKGGKTVKMPLDANSYLQQSYLFINDSAGYTWIATSNGMYKTRFSDLENYFRDSTYKVSYLHYGEEDGITSPEFNGGCVPSYVALKNGYISMPNVEGLVWFNPHEVMDRDFSRPFFIDGLYADDIPLPFADGANIGSASQVVKIDFSTPYWGISDNLQLQYKLEGYSPNWTPINKVQNSLIFTNLPSGNYTLHLRKRIGFNPNDYLIKSLTITINKKFYETFWFIGLCLTFALLFTFIVARLYAFNIEKRNIALEKNVQLRTFELIQANEELKQSASVKDKLISILTHDIITPLRFITLVARKGSDKSNNLDQQKIRDTLEDIKNSTQKLHDNAKYFKLD